MEACWNCRLYDDCENKFFVTNVCDKYHSVRGNTVVNPEIKQNQEDNFFCSDVFEV